jgi:hypothetical protein
MERYGTISDFSGWLIFTDVGGQYNGLGGNEWKHTENALQDYRKDVMVTELEISIKSLREFFLYKIKKEVSPLGSVSPTDLLRFRVDDLERLMTLSRSRILEFLTKLHFEQRFEDVKINFDDISILPRRREIDVLAISRSKGLAVVAECSTNVPLDRIDEFIAEMNEKAECLKQSEKYGGLARYEKIFVTSKWSILGIGAHRMKQIRRKFKRADIKVMSIFRGRHTAYFAEARPQGRVA